jgi:3,5-epimerase/4-reductase
MKILIYGGRGWIGSQFIDIIKADDGLCEHICGEARVDDPNALLLEIAEHNPTHIISLIGRTHGKIGDKIYGTIDYLEQDGKLLENVRDNLFAPLLLADICRKSRIHYTYLGTGCIFKYDGTHDESSGFAESSEPNFFGSSYSIVKGFTDRIMHLYGKDVLNLRIRMPITGSKNPRNFITKITNYEKICSMPNSMTVLPELLPIVLDMMKRGVGGTVNLTNPGTITHNEILEMYKEIVCPSFEWQNFTQEEQRAILASDRSNNYLDTTLLEQMYPEVSNIKDAVRKCLLTYKD